MFLLVGDRFGDALLQRGIVDEALGHAGMTSDAREGDPNSALLHVSDGVENGLFQPAASSPRTFEALRPSYCRGHADLPAAPTSADQVAGRPRIKPEFYARAGSDGSIQQSAIRS